MSLPFYLSSRRSRQRGFSLIEMLVVLTIFIIMLAVALANFPAFRDKTALQLIAQEIATTIRQAQVYGIGTRSAGGAFSSHGLYFDPDNSAGFGIDNKTFILYADNNLDRKFTSETDDRIVEKFAIRGGAEIVELWGCVGDCVNPVPTSLDELDIFFQRFYPEATLPTGYSYVKIVLKSTRTDEQKWVEVWNTGQISVKP